jgi:hypothetical protein
MAEITAGSLVGKSVLVTGGSSGIGRSLLPGLCTGGGTDDSPMDSKIAGLLV